MASVLHGSQYRKTDQERGRGALRVDIEAFPSDIGPIGLEKDLRIVILVLRIPTLAAPMRTSHDNPIKQLSDTQNKA